MPHWKGASRTWQAADAPTVPIPAITTPYIWLLRSWQARLRLTDLAVPISLGLWALGISQTNPRGLGTYGLLNVLPVTYYAGIGLLVISATVELARKSVSRFRMSVHASMLVVMLYGTAPLVYSQGRYSWLYKHIGIVQYVKTRTVA